MTAWPGNKTRKEVAVDIKEMADQIMGELSQAPEKIQEFAADPAAAIEKITGQAPSAEELGQIVDHVKAKIGEGAVDLQSLGEQLKDFVQGDDSPLKDISGLLDNIFKQGQ